MDFSQPNPARTHYEVSCVDSRVGTYFDIYSHYKVNGRFIYH